VRPHKPRCPFVAQSIWPIVTIAHAGFRAIILEPERENWVLTTDRVPKTLLFFERQTSARWPTVFSRLGGVRQMSFRNAPDSRGEYINLLRSEVSFLA
jgi:hypothetical protein